MHDRGLIRLYEGLRVDDLERILVPGAVVAGRVTTVMSGEPIREAAVFAQVQVAETDGDGRFRLEGVFPGEVPLGVRAVGFEAAALLAGATAGEESYFSI